MPTTQKPLRWGILGCGFISGDFVRAMESCEHPNEVSQSIFEIKF
jgi:predicted dehydrogenase